MVVGIFLGFQSNFGNSLNAGHTLFMILSWLSFVFVNFTGVFLTSDAVSEERREGTLGLLFLTDLRGYDVTLGKFMSASLQAFYGLLAVFPILALPLLMGGVTANEFWRMILALLNALFFSLAAGIFISSLSRDPQKALHAAFLLLLFFLVLLPAIDALYFFKTKSPSDLCVSIISPLYSFSRTVAKKYEYFWTSLAFTNLLGWMFLALASYYTPRIWQEKAAGTKQESRNYNWRFGSATRRKKLRALLIDKNPVYWLLARQRWHGLILRGILVILLAVMVYWYLRDYADGKRMGFSQGFASFTSIAFQIWMASQASRFFSEGMRTGSLELLLSTPLIVPQIIHGQWLALRRLFFVPTVLALMVQLFSNLIQIRFMLSVNNGPNQEWITYHVINLIFGMVGFITPLVALAWVGMWMGLTTAKPNIAVVKTFLFVQVIPWFGVIICQLLFFKFFAPSSMYGFSIFNGVLVIAKDVAFILWARRKLHEQLRDVASLGEHGLKFRAERNPATRLLRSLSGRLFS